MYKTVVRILKRYAKFLMNSTMKRCPI